MNPGAILYVRVSTEVQVTEGTSLASQEAACLKKAADMGLPVVGIHRDEGVSGALYIARPGIQKALSELESGRASVLICAKMDRSGRDVDINLDIRRRVQRAGAQLVFADGMNFEHNAGGDLMFTVGAGFAQYERAIIRERTSQGRKRKVLEGEMPYRNFSPFGYHIPTKAEVLKGEWPAESLGKFMVIEEEAATVRALFERHAAGESLRGIIAWLDREGVGPRRGGKHWYPSTIKRLLSHPVYKGETRIGRMECIHDEQRVQEGRKMTFVHRPRRDEDCLALTVPPIVSLEVWEACQRRLAGNQSSLGGAPTRCYPLASLLRCPECGRRMNGWRPSNVNYHYYLCTYKRTCSRPCGTLNGPALEKTLAHLLLSLVEEPALVEKAMQLWQAITPEEERELGRIRQELGKLETREKATVKAQIDGVSAGADTSLYRQVFADIRQQRLTLQSREHALTAKQQSAPPSRAQVVGLTAESIRYTLLDPAVPASVRKKAFALAFDEIVPSRQGGEARLAPLYGADGTVYYVVIYYTDAVKFSVSITTR